MQIVTIDFSRYGDIEIRDSAPESEMVVGFVCNDGFVRVGIDAINHIKAVGRYKKSISRAVAKFMAACDLGINWENLAKAPVLFCWDESNHVPYLTKKLVSEVQGVTNERD